MPAWLPFLSCLMRVFSEFDQLSHECCEPEFAGFFGVFHIEVFPCGVASVAAGDEGGHAGLRPPVGSALHAMHE